MTNEETFHAALREDPLDELTWSALADFLDDDNQSDRAALLRLTRRIAMLPVHEKVAEQAEVLAMLDSGVKPVVVQRQCPDMWTSRMWGKGNRFNLDMTFSLVMPGTFIMGDVRPVNGNIQYCLNLHAVPHEVLLTEPFWISTTPVTQKQFVTMRHENPSAFRKSGPRGNLVKNYDTDLFPVDRVTRYHVDAFISTAINGLGEKDHRRYKFNIPTEAQWEYACRGGPYWSTKLYHIGRPSNKLLPHQANYWPEALRSEEGSDEIDEALAEDVSSHNQAMRTYRPTTVKSYPPNVLGLYDMHGNVGEWCKDLYMHAYHSRMFTDSTESLMTNYRRVDPQQGDGRPLATDEYVVRGGGFMSGEIGLEACARHHTTDINSSAYRRFPYLGFRVIMISR